ncbi:hypothetical protein Clacol_006551 [Clathrus columnatus]|uniref:6,7-dimethyl-8-ribityllumazine synthase n=1 Tax=Clathrus columnatus TaxID=1419009 RepID=A0AAV5AK23_9AGAM|nr:hypothetical protein Clacol_006551 [Clathrus columnatus]
MSTVTSIKGIDLSYSSSFDGSSLRIGIVHARWNAPIIEALLQGTRDKLVQCGVKSQNIVVQSVPGSFELPFATKKMIAGSHVQANVGTADLMGMVDSTSSLPTEVSIPSGSFDAVIAIGVLIKGATMHFEYISEAVTHGLMNVQLESGVPVIFGVLTALNEEQALERAGIGKGANGKGHNHGEDWGAAAVEMASNNLAPVLLMGKSGSGKTSMRSVIFSNNPANLTSRLGATIDVEQNHVRFLGDLILNLWDCGGQETFMDHYLTSQRSTIFRQVGVLIYVFDVESRDREMDLKYYQECLQSLKTFSPDAGVFVLVHKMDLVRGDKVTVFNKKKLELEEAANDIPVTVFGTSIWDESLYRAWSRIVHNLIPNAPVLAKHLAIFGEACSAREVVLFERTTFLVIASSASIDQSSTDLSSGTPADGHSSMLGTRYERTSELIKSFKHSCSRSRAEFQSLEMELPGYTAVLDELTRNTYIMVIVHDPTIETAAIRMNIALARPKFEELQADNNNVA